MKNKINKTTSIKDKNWEENFEELKKFRQNNPSIWPAPKERRLYYFCYRNIQKYKFGIMDKIREQKLKEIGFDFTLTTPWKIRFEQLKDFLKNNQGVIFLYNSRNPLEKKLSRFISHNRKKYNKGELEQEKIDLFKDIGIDFSINRDYRWRKMYALLKEFMQKNLGRELSYRNKDNPLERKLYYFVAYHRYRYNKGRLEQEKIDLFKQIGLDKQVMLRGTHKEVWRKKYALLKEFIHNRQGVFPRSHFSRDNKDPLEKELYRFIVYNNKRYNKGELEQEKIDLFREIGIDLNKKIHNYKWEKKYALLKEFIQNNQGRIPSSRKSKAPLEKKIYRFMAYNKTKYNKGKLEQEKIGLFKQIGIDFSRK